LAAPGVAAHQISKHTGFKGIFGPIRAKDIKDYIENDFKASAEMRQVNFNLRDRLVVAPLEFAMSMKYFPIILAFLFIIHLLKGWEGGLLPLIMVSLSYLGAIVVATLIFPILLPVLPFRMFFLKSFFLAGAWTVITFIYRDVFFIGGSNFQVLGHCLIMSSFIGYLGTNFTGSTTFTSLSGVYKETVIIIIIAIIGIICGLSLLALDIFV